MISTNQMTIQLPTATKMAEFEEETIPSILLPCTSCNRTFRPEALSKHVKYCEKTLIKKRKVFDSAKQRIQGTDLAEFLPVLTHKKKFEKSPVRKTQSKWKEKHMELVRAIRAARTGPSDDLPPTPIKPSDHEKCPHCERYFGPKAYDRHLEWCKEHSSRIQPKSPASIQAKERLEARTKYRAPVISKSRRAMMRDKILPATKNRDPSPVETTPKSTVKSLPNRVREQSPMGKSSKNYSSSPATCKKTTVLPKGDLNSINASSRSQHLRNSKRNPSPMKKTSTPIKSQNSEVCNNTPQKLNQIASVNPNDDYSVNQGKEDIFTASCNISSIQPKETPRPKMKTVATSSLVSNHNSSSPVPVPKTFANEDSSESKLQDQHQNSSIKFCSDSAYNSLNRKSPHLEENPVIENGSSSGSESSFPPVKGQSSHAARFCHECGAKYPVLVAKFCCQCGVRRLVI